MNVTSFIMQDGFKAEQHGWTRQIEMNKKVADRLEVIISTLEKLE